MNLKQHNRFWLVLQTVCFILLSLNTMPVLPAEPGMQLRVALLVFSGAQRNTYEEVAYLFEQAHPGTEVLFISADDDNYKDNLDIWLAEESTGVDVLMWQGGERLRSYVKQGHVEPLDDIWEKAALAEHFEQHAKDAVMADGRPYAIPYAAGFWGFYYLPELFNSLDIRPPKNWNEFLDVGKVLKKNQIIPIAMGNKQQWPSAAWFDYFNMRLNGLDFHLDTVQGKVDFTSPKIRNLFKHWQLLLEESYFFEHANIWEERQILPLLYRKRVGMILSGNYVISQLPVKLREEIDFFRFPVLGNAVPLYENSPVDVFLIPRNARNIELAKRFLLFVSDKKIQEMLNERTYFVPAHIAADVSGNKLVLKGQQLLRATKGTGQYFDRDTSQIFAPKALQIFSDFMTLADVDQTTKRLEQARAKYFQPQIKSSN